MCHKLASGLMALLMVSASMFAVSKAHAAQKLALFPFELVDVAQDPGAMGYGVGFGGLPKGPDSDEVRRLKLITDDLSRRITEVLHAESGPVLIEGHTDNVPLSGRGRFKDNYQLSKTRADVLAEVLRPLLADPTRITAEGRGEDDPVGDNTTPEGRAANRRVEIMLAREGTYEAPIAFVPETTN